jgi:hypothetical protein
MCGRDLPQEPNPHRPFCSERCRLLDLSAWTSERYRIPGDPVPSGVDDEPAPDGPKR